MKILLIDSVL